MNTDKLAQALAIIGSNSTLLTSLLELCRKVESTLARRDFDVREEVTGPIVDALFANVDPQVIHLKQGLEFHFHYRSKIARDLVMSRSPQPDHVWEPQTTKLLLHLCDNASNLVIGGAYAGDHAILAANVMSRNGGVCHCFEPNKEQLEMLRHNAEVNGLTNIILNEMGLWQTDDTDLVLVGEDSFAHPEPASSVHTSNSFSTVTVNSYGANLDLERINMIFLDIEGGELPALKGADRYLAESPDVAPNLIFEVHRHYVDWSDGLHKTDILRYLSEFGYVTYAIRDYQSNVPMEGYPIELIEPEHVVLEGPAHGFNMLAVKRPEIVRNDLFRFRANVSPKLLFHRDPRLHQPQPD